ncbi:hypothetical protein ACFBZI_11380 [Moraxella sp. ZJ142]|uniref:hypothetical protein n=1 Tax=Moraxella marmotae TaxID=3344520 RepID=UPI0035D4C66C
MSLFASKIQSVIVNALAALKTTNEDYCSIETIDSSTNIVFENGSLMSLIRYDGLMSIITVDEFYDMIQYMARDLNNFMAKPGYKIACVFRKDLNSYSLLERSKEIQKKTASVLLLDVDDLIEEESEEYQKRVYNEEVWFAVITQPVVLDKVERQTVAEEHMAYVRPPIRNAQNVLQPLDVIRSKHQTFVGAVSSALSNRRFYCKAEVVNVLDALNFVKRQVVPDLTSKKWMPATVLGSRVAEYLGYPNYQTPITWPITHDKNDMSHLFPPKLSRQIMASTTMRVMGAKEGLPNNTVSMGGRLFAGCMMDIAPSQPNLFNALFSAFNQKTNRDLSGKTVTMPYSISFMLTSDCLASMAIKRAMAGFLAKVPPITNQNLRYSLDQLKVSKNEGLAVVGLQISAMTWVDDTPECYKLLRDRKQQLQATMEAWGGMTTKDNVGDPLMLWQSNVLGLNQQHVGTKAAVELPKALAMLPLTRPATPFPKGTIPHSTLDGKLMMLEKFSPLQTTWITIITGIPGSGKSVLLNNTLVNSCLMAGISKLPWISVIDKGFSSTGFIQLLQDRLPPERKHLVVAKKLRKDKKHAINPLTTLKGLPFPLEWELQQMVSFMTTITTPAELEKPYEGTTSFWTEVIRLTFDSIQDTGANSTPKMYRPHDNEELDSLLQEYKVLNYRTYQVKDKFGRIIDEYDYEVFDEISNFSLERKLHVMSEQANNKRDSERLARAADLAHRYAMPVLADMISIIKSAAITDIYTNKVASTESMPDFALRALSNVIAEYECFSYHTEFDVDTARVMALDLNDVVDRRNRQQTALFFQIARMVSVKNFALSEDDLRSGKIPALFMPYYERRLKDLRSERKILAFDELHNAKGDMATMKQLETDAREGRKWGLELILSSHKLGDFRYEGPTEAETVDLLSFSTTVCVCSEPTEKDLDIFKKSLSSNPGVINGFDNIGLSAHGLTYFVWFKTKAGKFSQYLTSSVGPKRLWSLTTDQTDRAMLQAVSAKVPSLKRAIEVLAWFFGPGASSKVKERLELEKRDPNAGAMTKQREAGVIDQMALEAIHAYEYHEHQMALKEKKA